MRLVRDAGFELAIVGTMRLVAHREALLHEQAVRSDVKQLESQLDEGELPVVADR